MTTATLIIRDYTNYNPHKCHKGGAYGFIENATVESGKIAKGYFWTTADFSYCKCCGRFEQRIDEHVERQHDGNKDDYQPSPEMVYAIGLLGENEPQQAVELFDEWGQGPMLTIEN